MNKITNYVYTNSLSLRGYIWRAYLIIVGLGIVGSIIGVYWMTSQDKIQQGLQSDIVSDMIQEVGNILDEGEVITINGATLTANPDRIDFHEDQSVYRGINTQISCTDFFNMNKQGVAATTDAICFRDFSNKQQIITREQINQGRAEIGAGDLNSLQAYPSITNLISANPLTIDSNFAQSLESEFRLLVTDPIAIEGAHHAAKFMRRPILLGITIVWIIASAILLFTMILLPLIFLTLVSRAMMSISGYSSSFQKEFSKTWLPGTVILILTWIIPGIGFWIGVLVWLIFPIAYIIHRKKSPPSVS